MMEFIRRHSQGPIVKLLFFGILISFLGFGSVSMFGGGQGKIATINGKPVDVDLLKREYEQLVRQQKNIEDLTAEDHRELKRIAMQNVFEEVILDQKLSEWGVTASDQDVAKRIIADPTFHEEGKFSGALYSEILKVNRMKEVAYEEMIRRSLAQQKILNSIIKTTYVVPRLLENVAKAKNEKRDIKLASIYYHLLSQTMDVSDTEIEDYYNTHLDQYMTDDRYKVAYIELSNNQDSNVELTDEEFSEALAKKKSMETRIVDQIVIEPNNEEEKEAALAKLNELYRQISAGDITFEEAANSLTDYKNAFYLQSDSYTKGMSGSPIFDNKLFDMTLDETIIAPFEAETAIHLLAIKEIDGTPQSEEEIRKEALDEKRQTLYFNQVKRLQELSDLYQDGLNEIASDLNLEVKTTDWLSANDENGFLGEEKIRNAFMNANVLESHKNSLPFSVDDNHAMMVRVADYEPKRQQTLEEAQNNIVELLKVEKYEVLVMADVKEIEEAAAKSNADFEKAVKAKGFEYYEYNGIRTSDLQNLGLRPVEMMGVFYAFQISGIKENEFKFNINKQPIGLSLALISNVEEGKIEDFDAPQREEVLASMLVDEVNAEYRAFMDSLLEESKIKYFQNDFLE